MRWFQTGCTIIAGFCAGLNPAHAAEFSFSKTDKGTEIIYVNGEISEGDDEHFRRLALSSDDAIVVLSSPGGSLLPALEIGRTIQLKGFTTYVPDGIECVSACALVWVAGTRRYMSSRARVGFHASYRNLNGRQEEVGVANAVVGRYLTLLNLPESAVIFATAASPTTVTWLNRENAKLTGITFEIFDFSEETTSQASVDASQSRTQNGYQQFDWSETPWKVWSRENGCSMGALYNKEGKNDNISSIYISVDYSTRDISILMFSNHKFKSLKKIRNII